MAVSTEDRTGQLRRGWTTGACATAATRAAYTALLTGAFPDPVTITLPRGERPAFPLALEERGEGWARAGIVKDAGDDPDVTHGALVIATVREAPRGSGVIFRAGPGVGTVTRPGLPVAPGEPAINPVPREMMRAVVAETAQAHGAAGDVVIEISVPEGAALAARTWNPRLGIEGGISILGTTGVVRPFSCSAWIHAIRSGIDVARAAGLQHIAGATGATSEAAVKAFHGLDDLALIDMGDFVGGMLKYLRRHPVPRVTIAGGFAKMTKLAQGRLDLHSGRSQVDFAWLAQKLKELGAGGQLLAHAREANTAREVLEMAGAAGLDIAGVIAACARETAGRCVAGAVSPIDVDVLVVSGSGEVIAHAGER
ncbi:MAG: cobalt-precorrin-5B (C(1))-methyltransferase [Methyloligellaceae bacterium]